MLPRRRSCKLSSRLFDVAGGGDPMLGWTYCQIYCQKRGDEGIPGDGEPHVFSNLLISICVYVGSTKSQERFWTTRMRRSGAKRRTSGRPRPRAIPPSPPLVTSILRGLDQSTATGPYGAAGTKRMRVISEGTPKRFGGPQ